MSTPGSPGQPGGSGSDQESKSERLTRNFNELLQELRVTQTGVQILTGFLLTLPFTQRFASLDGVQKTSYLLVLSASVVATGLIIAPVSFHRTLFRQGEKDWLVDAANWCARAGLVALATAMVGVVWLVFDVVASRGLAVAAGIVAAVFFAGLWAGVPLAKRGAD